MKRALTILSICLGLSASLQAQDLAPIKLTAEAQKALGLNGKTATSVSDHEWKISDGTTVYSSVPYGQDIFGYSDCTPMFIAIKDGKISAVTPGPNNETPEYWVFLEEEDFFNNWNGKNIKEAEALEVDAISGATFSSESVIGNIKATLQAILKK